MPSRARFSILLALAVAISALLAACGSSTTPQTKAFGSRGQPSCNEAFAAVMAGAGAATARLGPLINWSGPETFILSFTTAAARDEAVRRLRAAPPAAFDVAAMHVFRNLAMLALPTPAASETGVAALRTALDGLPLISIWGNEPRRYYLESSKPVVGAELAEETFGLTGAGIGIAIIDSGIDTTQGDFPNVAFNAKFVPGFGFVESPDSDSTSGHGTHVAGTAGGSGARSGGRFRGMASGATLIGLGMGDIIVLFDVVSAFDFILEPGFRAAHNIRVTNNSYGPVGDPVTGEAPAFDPADPTELAVKAAYDAGIINVFAAGNSGPGERTLSPHAANPCTIGVGNANREGGLSSTSSRGRSDDPFYVVDLSAPGTSITAPRALSGGVTPSRPDFPAYSTISGTSMATPHVAGAVALLLQADPRLSFEDVQSILQDTAVPMRADEPITDVQTTGEFYEPWEAGPGMMNVAAAAADVLRRRAPALTVGRFDVRPRGGETVMGRWLGLAGFILGAAQPVGTPRLNPCLCGVFDRHYVVDVPSLRQGFELRVRLAYEHPEETWRIRIFGPPTKDSPAGEMLADVNSQLSGATELLATVANPKAGTYRARVSEYQTQGSRIEVKVSLARP